MKLATKKWYDTFGGSVPYQGLKNLFHFSGCFIWTLEILDLNFPPLQQQNNEQM